MRRIRNGILTAVLAASLVLPAGGLVPAVQAADSGQAAVTTIYHETFENGAGKAAQAGSASLSVVKNKVFDGNADGAALYVSNRVNNWDSADFSYSALGLVDGKTYTVTAILYVDADVSVPEGAKAALQTVDSYENYAEANFTAGQAVTLTREFTADTDKDTALRINSNAEGKAVPYYIGDVLFTEQAAAGGGEQPPRDPALSFAAITFEDQSAGGFTGRSGQETLTVTDEANHTENGAYALKVENRSDTWHGPSLRIEKYVDQGSEYRVSAWVKLISPESSQLQLSTQIGDGSSANYVALSPKTVNAADGWVKFEGSYRYNSVGGEYLTLYVESANNKSASFYIDDIRFERTGAGPIEIQKDLVPVKAAYGSDFLIGNAISAEDLEGPRLELLKMHHNVATAGNAMKPDALQPTKGNFTFAAADAMVSKVLAEGMKMHGHVLVWHEQSPAWLNTTQDAGGNTVPLGRDEALENMRTHIRTVMEHFGDKVISWDVVNEAMSDNPGSPADWEKALRQSPWQRAIGSDYVEQAFLAAREVLDDHPAWDIKLYYNDYNDDNQNKATAIYSMVKAINDKYALTHPGKRLIDGIGMQGHYNVNTNPENVKLSLEKFLSLGVEVSVTELDIQAGSKYELSDKLAEAQGYLYAQLLKIYKEHAAGISRVTFWGMDDNTSWRAENNPLLFDKNLQAKPAYYGVIDPEKYIAEHQPDTTDANQSTAEYGSPTIDGNVDAAWSAAAEMPVNRYQLAWQGASGTAKALWDEKNLYVLIQVSDAQLDKSNANKWEQDSIEVFLDENNAKTTFYQEDDGQFRVNFDNETSFSPESFAAGFESATKVSGTSYTVELKIPFRTVTGANHAKLGFDVQINDAKDGARQSVAAWNDTTGNGYQDTSVYGILSLTGKPVQPGSPTPGSSSESNAPVSPVEVKDGVITLKPQVTTAGGIAKAEVSSALLKKALEQALSSAGGRKEILVEVPKQAGADSYEVQLRVQGLKGQADVALLLKTELGTVAVPSQMLSTAASDKETVTFRLKQAPVQGVSGPALELGVLAGGQAVPWEMPITVSLPYTPLAEQLRTSQALVVKRVDESGGMAGIPSSRYDAASGALVFRTTQAGTFAAVYAPPRFADTGNVSWAQEAIAAMAARDILQGVSADSYAPAAPVTRAEFVALLVKALELKGPVSAGTAFSDVPPGAAYAGELSAAQQLGMVNGYADHTFRPDGEITRQDMIVLAARALAAAGKPVPASGLPAGFTDAGQVAAYAKDSLAALLKAGIVNGKNGLLAPGDPLTRAEAAVIVYRLWQL
ncbi:endo-1,4-beta-xylanase [Paenibacillus sp. NFR01]|uniref:endo-1,4-beta-xylanase n=1 Tax=Paenibacillus sp. NFR01 TaxID=1566279 RepID=UPI0008BE69A8|nr:endo-1,4-beta-xylanase [Paenibacillus sp. NFR01]SET89094.1 endo-1,4-beta-xylanase [Paenibacillus sp. NFR01]